MEGGLSDSPDIKRMATQNVRVEGIDEPDGKGRPNASEPIAIKGELGWLSEPIAIKGELGWLSEPVAIEGELGWLSEPIAIEGELGWLSEPIAIKSELGWLSACVNVAIVHNV